MNRTLYAKDMPAVYLKQSLMNILPDRMKQACRKDPKCKAGTWNDVWDWVKEEIKDLNNGRLAQNQAAHRQQAIKKHAPQSFVAAAADVPDAIRKRIEKMEQMCAALTKQTTTAPERRGRGDRRGRNTQRAPSGGRRSRTPSPGGNRNRPDAKWNNGACWECGETRHPRRECPKFIALLEANNKLPPNHKGAYELHVEQQAKLKQSRVSAIGAPATPIGAPSAPSEACTEDQDELIQGLGTVPSWGCAILGGADEQLEEHNEEQDVVDQLHEAPRALPKPKFAKLARQPQEQRRETYGTPGKSMTDEQLAEVCAAVENGDIKLPKVQEGESIWLLDSGSRPTIANKDKHFPGATLKQSQAQRERKGYTSATGELFKNEGEFTTPRRTQEGHRRTVTFQHSTKVSLPILSTGGLTDLDNNVMYRKHDGYIEHIPTGDRSYFFKLHGVYFIKM